jgi:hypothetical protein
LIDAIEQKPGAFVVWCRTRAHKAARKIAAEIECLLEQGVQIKRCRSNCVARTLTLTIVALGRDVDLGASKTGLSVSAELEVCCRRWPPTGSPGQLRSVEEFAEIGRLGE